MKATHSSRRSLRAAALAGLVGAAALAALAAACRPGARRPDVVLVTIDTLRADHCSMSGYPIATTPNLDALAAGGQRFATAYAESSTTAPSHAVLMTGRHFRTLGLTRNGGAIPEDAVTLAERLRDEGYATAAFVSSFPVRRARPTHETTRRLPATTDSNSSLLLLRFHHHNSDSAMQVERLPTARMAILV